MAKYESYIESRSSARFVPSTRVLIFAKAMSLDVDVSSATGENPQSSVVPGDARGMNSAASITLARTCSAGSTLELMG